MKFLKQGDEISSNIFNQLEEKRLEMLARGVDVINLSIGTPDFTPDEHVMRAVQEAAMDPENYKYTLSDIPELTAAVQRWYARRYGVTLEPEQIQSVNGSQEGIAHICFPFLQPGDLVLCPDPGYPIFTFGPMMAGAEIGLFPLLPENDYLIDFDSIPDEVADRAKMMVVSYPCNPMGRTAPREFYEKLVAFAKKHDIIVIHDNAYSDLVMDGGRGLSFLSVDGAMDIGIEMNSLSKTYNLTGMRISFAIGNADLINQFRAFRSQIDYGMYRPIQLAAVAALDGPQELVERNRAGYQERRDVLCGGLRKAGWNVPDSQATMFVWAKIPDGFASSTAFVLELLERAGVLCVPGDSFGEHGEGYVRFALTAPPERLQTAVDRIAACGILSGSNQ